jgi:hypothetical protein
LRGQFKKAENPRKIKVPNFPSQNNQRRAHTQRRWNTNSTREKKNKCRTLFRSGTNPLPSHHPLDRPPQPTYQVSRRPSWMTSSALERNRRRSPFPLTAPLGKRNGSSTLPPFTHREKYIYINKCSRPGNVALPACCWPQIHYPNTQIYFSFIILFTNSLAQPQCNSIEINSFKIAKIDEEKMLKNQEN